MTKPLFIYDPAPYGIQELAAGNHSQQDEIFGARAAAGLITFSGNPTAGHTITLNGVVFTFQAGASAGTGVQIKASLTLTLDELVSILNASVNAAISVATYANSGGTILTVTYDTEGTAGNAYTLASSNVNGVVSAATLAGGTAQTAIDMKKETTILSTAAGTAQNWDLPDGNDAQEKTLLLKTKGAGANAVVRGTFVGGTKVTFDTALKWGKFKWLAGAWRPIANTGSIS